MEYEGIPGFPKERYNYLNTYISIGRSNHSVMLEKIL